MIKANMGIRNRHHVGMGQKYQTSSVLEISDGVIHMIFGIWGKHNSWFKGDLSHFWQKGG